MGTSRSGLDWARKLTEVAATLPATAEGGVLKAAETVRVAVALASGQYASSPLVRTKVTPLPPMAAEVRMVDRKAHLLDHDTRAISRTGGDTILPGAITGVRGRKQALFIGSGNEDGRPVSRSRKGATRGKFMWERGVAAALPKISQTVANQVAARILKAFG